MSKRLISVAAALMALTGGMLVSSPVASAKAGPIEATYKLAPGFYNLAIGLNAVWAVNADEIHDSQLYRIDPNSHGMKLVTTLPFPAGGIAVAYDSVWVSDYFGNSVWRLGSGGQVQAEIGVGLQPQFLHAAFGSIWSSNHHGASLTRIDAASNAVQDTVQVGAPNTFRDGPLQMTDDGTNLYVTSADLPDLQMVDPTTDAVSTGPTIDDQFCGPLAAIDGFVWSVDACTSSTYQLAPAGSVAQVIPSTGAPESVATLGSQLWISDALTFDFGSFLGSDAALDQLDPGTGALERTVAIGGDASDVVGGFGDLWVYDGAADTVRRVDV